MSTSKKFKVVYGYDGNAYMTIDENDLPKAYAVFIEGAGRALFSTGEAIRGQDIIRIEIDWHADQDWNKGYEMQVLDYEYVKPYEKGYKETMMKARHVAEFAIKENRRDLLLKPLSESFLSLPEKTEKSQEVSEMAKQLADKFNINKS